MMSSSTPALVSVLEEIQSFTSELTLAIHRVSDVVDELVSCALVQRHSATNTLSTHRLIQTEFRYYIKENLQHTFLDLSKLFYESFRSRYMEGPFNPSSSSAQASSNTCTPFEIT